MSSGNAVVLAPIDYVRLIFAVIIGVFFFSEVPTLWMFAGGALIVGSTLYITLSEALPARRQARTAAAV